MSIRMQSMQSPLLAGLTRVAIACAALSCVTSAFAQTPYSMPPIDAPELAKLGIHGVGTHTLTLTNRDQPDLPKMMKTLGFAGKSDRSLKVDVWYPAKPQAGAPPVAYKATLPSRTDTKRSFEHVGIAVRDAPAVEGQKFPLVLVSHGFGGWSTFMSYLTENLASKGYVVASIDHADMPFTDGGSFGLSFGTVLVHRTRDQQFVLSELVAATKSGQRDWHKVIDTGSIGIIGYSMGGFGALATAGAGYDPASPTFKQLPAALIAPQTEGNEGYKKAAAERTVNVKALVLIAPWGGQPANRAWTNESLKAVRMPSLTIVGDQDDVVEYEQGARFIFNSMARSNRKMLVYQGARHNVGGNIPPPEAMQDFTMREYFDEPVWRKDRLNAINQHFVTAFLDLHLKGDKSRSCYLDVPTVQAKDATWTVAFGKSVGASVGNGEGDTAKYWCGFQRRWLLGLELHSQKAAQ